MKQAVKFHWLQYQQSVFLGHY